MEPCEDGYPTFEGVLRLYPRRILRGCEAYIIDNPAGFSKVVSLVRLSSYVVGGRSYVLSEMLYASANLLSAVQEEILHRQTYQQCPTLQAPESTVHRLELALKLLSAVEVFAEVSARAFGHKRGQWMVLMCVAVTRAAARLLLLLRHGRRMYCAAPLTTQRDVGRTSQDDQTLRELSVDMLASDPSAATFTLTRSGRVVKSIVAAPSTSDRPSEIGAGDYARQQASTGRLTAPPSPVSLSGRQLFGELLHILRPIVHLCLLSCSGGKAWGPWLAALGADLASTMLSYDVGKQFAAGSPEEAELRRRSTLLLFYLLRSPFFERHSREKVIAVLRLFSYIPLVGYAADAVLQYVLALQKIYSYVWTQ